MSSEQWGSGVADEGRKEKGVELVGSEKVVYLQVENKNADENRNSENS